jgi:hypothetical protein
MPLQRSGISLPTQIHGRRFGLGPRGELVGNEKKVTRPYVDASILSATKAPMFARSPSSSRHPRERQREQRVVVRRLPVEHVEAGARDLVRGKRIVQRRLVDDAAARRVDHEGMRPQRRELGGPDQATALGAERHVHGHHSKKLKRSPSATLAGSDSDDRQPETQTILSRPAYSLSAFLSFKYCRTASCRSPAPSR